MEYKNIENCSVEIFEKFTEEDYYNFNLKLYRSLREIKLIESDKYINMADRCTEEQIKELKTYRQELRDFVNLNNEAFIYDKNKHTLKDGYTPESLLIKTFPVKPSFI